jgi:hypothetical protein
MVAALALAIGELAREECARRERRDHAGERVRVDPHSLFPEIVRRGAQRPLGRVEAVQEFEALGERGPGLFQPEQVPGLAVMKVGRGDHARRLVDLDAAPARARVPGRAVTLPPGARRILDLGHEAEVVLHALAVAECPERRSEKGPVARQAEAVASRQLRMRIDFGRGE